MSRSTFKVLFFLKRDKQKTSGKIPLFCRITVDGQETRFGMKCDVNPQIWDVKTCKTTGRTTESVKINALVDNTKAAIYKVYHQLQERDNYVTAERVKNVFLGTEGKQQTLLALFDRHNSERKTQIGITICDLNYGYYVRTRTRLAEFIRWKYKISDIPVKNIDHKFISNFRIYLTANYQYAYNTLTKYLKNLRHVIGIAIDEEMIAKNPFAKHSIQYQNPTRNFLTKDEIEILSARKFDSIDLEQTRDVFLFCSFTGLSYTDLCGLSEENIQQSFDGKLWIKGKRHKTEVEYDIPLLDIPRMIIEKYAVCNPDGKLLPVPQYQKYRYRLKRIGKICDINKNLISHLARHTFATFTLTKGVSIESVSKMLGHKNIKTTQIYAKITNEKISNDMTAFSEKIKNFGVREIEKEQMNIHDLIERWHISTEAWDGNGRMRLDDLWQDLDKDKKVSIISQIDGMENKPETVSDLCRAFQSIDNDFFVYVYEYDKNDCTFYKTDKSYEFYKTVESLKISVMPWDKMTILRIEDFWLRSFDDEKRFILSEINSMENKPKNLQELNYVVRKLSDEFNIILDGKNNGNRVRDRKFKENHSLLNI